MLKMRREENKVAAEEENKDNAMKNIVKISVAIGGVAITGLAVKHFLFGEEKEYAEQEITQVEKPEKPEQNEDIVRERSEDIHPEAPNAGDATKPETDVEEVEESVDEPDETSENSEAMPEYGDQEVETEAEKTQEPEPEEDTVTEAESSENPNTQETPENSETMPESEEKSAEETPVHPGVTTSLVIYDTLAANELNAALLSSCIDMLDKVIGDLNPIMDELSTNEKTVVDIAVDTLNGKLTIWWINCLDLLNVIYPDLGVRAKINVEGMYLKEKYSSIKYMKKSADVLKYQEETFSKLKEIEETENIRAMERMESETQTSEQVSDETQAEPAETTGETQTVDNASADENQAVDESKDGEIRHH